MQYLGHTHTKTWFVVYLKFKWNRVSHIFILQNLATLSGLQGAALTLLPCCPTVLSRSCHSHQGSRIRGCILETACLCLLYLVPLRKPCFKNNVDFVNTNNMIIAIPSGSGKNLEGLGGIHFPLKFLETDHCNLYLTQSSESPGWSGAGPWPPWNGGLSLGIWVEFQAPQDQVAEEDRVRGREEGGWRRKRGQEGE